MANPEGTVSHLWKTKKERKLRKSTIHSFQTMKPQFQNCDGAKAVCFWIQIQVFGHYAQAFGVAFTIPLCFLIRQAWQRPQMPKRGRRKEFKQVLGKCSVFGSRMKSFVKTTLVYQSTPPLHRLKLPIPSWRRQDTECQAEGWTRAWRGMTFGHEFNQKLEGVKLPNSLPNSTFGRVYPIPWGYINATYPRTPVHITYHS